MRWAIAAFVLTATTTAGDVMQLGRGLGPYRIGAVRTTYPNLIRAIRHPANDGGGCSGGFLLDSYVDVYPRLRLGYVFGIDKKLHLDTVATTRPGDRSAIGFTVGRSTIADVHRRYPHLRIRRHQGGSTITFVHLTGYEMGEQLMYSFDSRGILAALQTDVGGC